MERERERDGEGEKEREGDEVTFWLSKAWNCFCDD